MTKTIEIGDKIIHTLSVECVEELHDLLSNNYKKFKNMEPISPPGIKNKNMLASAVFRQETGMGSCYKYDDEYLSCATLVFGITKNHAFHNGNKRVGLLSLIKHLYVNGLVLDPKVSENELFQLMLDTVQDKLIKHAKKYSEKYTIEEDSWSDEESINYLAYWISKNSIKKYYHTANELKIRAFKKILENHNIEYKEDGVNIVLVKYEKLRFFGLKKKKEITGKYRIGKKKNVIKKRTLERFRKDFNLTKSDGMDNTTFFDEDSFIQEEITKYKSIIYRLSKT